MCARSLQHLKQRGYTYPIHVQIIKHVKPREEAKAQEVTARRYALSQQAMNTLMPVAQASAAPHAPWPGGDEPCDRRLRKEDDKFQDDARDTGVAVTICDDDCRHWEACIMGTPGSPYEGGIFFLNVLIPNNYPFSPPRARFITPIYHCNVSADGDLNLDVAGTWSPALGIRTLLLSIMAILTSPDPNDACCAAIGREELGKVYRNDRAAYHMTAREWTQEHARSP